MYDEARLDDNDADPTYEPVDPAHVGVAVETGPAAAERLQAIRDPRRQLDGRDGMYVADQTFQSARESLPSAPGYAVPGDAASVPTVYSDLMVVQGSIAESRIDDLDRDVSISGNPVANDAMASARHMEQSHPRLPDGELGYISVQGEVRVETNRRWSFA